MMIGHVQPKTFHVGFRRPLILCKGKMVWMPDCGVVKVLTTFPQVPFTYEKNWVYRLPFPLNWRVKADFCLKTEIQGCVPLGVE